jgi:hypothetical protein
MARQLPRDGSGRLEDDVMIHWPARYHRYHFAAQRVSNGITIAAPARDSLGLVDSSLWMTEWYPNSKRVRNEGGGP